MTDITAMGRRPNADRGTREREHTSSECGEKSEIYEDVSAVCPGVDLRHTFDRNTPSIRKELRNAWGPVYEVWEGFAADSEIRRMGSSGGAATALALHCIEQEGMHGVLHTAARKDRPYLNRTVMSRSREDLLSATGSRYAPASPCEGLDQVAMAPEPCVFIGKPCDVAGAHKLRQFQPELDAKLGLTIAFFCAGTPSTRGTLDLLAHVGVDDPASITSLRYRGNGWPGKWTVTYRDDEAEEHTASMSYEDSWGFLQKYRQWRCRICPDHTGEFADIAVGDPWYRRVEPGELGKSLIVVRNERGLQVLHAAAEAGYIVLEKQDSEFLPRSQPNLHKTRGRLWGQLQAMRVVGSPTPRFRGFPMAGIWWRHLTMREKVSSIVGTWRRVRTRTKVRNHVFGLSASFRAD